MSWRILTSRIVHDGAGHLSVTICHRHPRGHVFYVPRLAPTDRKTEQPVYCPVCAADRGLTVSGAWGGPAQMACPYGHDWTPHLPGMTPEQLLREVVRHALGEGELYFREARIDPQSATPPSPLRDAVRETLSKAAIALNRREWEFDDYEVSVAVDLVHRSRWPDTITSQDEATDAARLGWLYDGLAALHEYSKLTTGRLGDLLTACDTALRPAADLRLDDPEPGPDKRNPPALLDAELALGGLRQVLVAGGSGDVDW